jgi:glycosyltransferase involved in cell wall biosynthesis
MRVAVSTIGKFHSFDLARQMHKRGALASIFSGYPWFKLKTDGLPKQKVKTFPYLHAPYMRLAPRCTSARLLWEWQDRVWFDRYVARHLPPCDVFCGLSGSALRTGLVAKSQGAKYVCDRASSHIRFHDRILREEYDRQGIAFSGIDPRIISREEAEYQAADVITVPSTFVLNTFIEAGVARNKMRLAPYGVDLNRFHPCALRSDDAFRILFVGGVSVRKGISYLLNAFQQLQCRNKQLALVGSVSREVENILKPLRHNAAISVIGHVPQERLKEIMSVSHVMVLPSVEEGLAYVQAQAMACGCPVIASQNTGADDLFEDGKEGFIVPIRDTEAITERLQRLADNPDLRSQMGALALERVKSIGGWEQYGARMYQIFSEPNTP